MIYYQQYWSTIKCHKLEKWYYQQIFSREHQMSEIYNLLSKQLIKSQSQDHSKWICLKLHIFQQNKALFEPSVFRTLFFLKEKTGKKTFNFLTKALLARFKHILTFSFNLLFSFSFSFSFFFLATKNFVFHL